MALHTILTKRILVAVSSMALLAALAPCMALADDEAAEVPEEGSTNQLVALTIASDTFVGSVVDTIADVINQLNGTIGNEPTEGQSALDDVASEISDAAENPGSYLDGNSSGSAGDEFGDSSAASPVSTQADDATYLDNSLTWKTDPGSAASAWYDSAAAATAHGTAELVKVDLPNGGGTFTAAQLTQKTNADSAYYLNGVLRAPEGSTITMKLLPARFYQLLSNKICGGTIQVTPVESDEEGDEGTYTFAMPKEGKALDVSFTAATDKVVVDSSAVTAGTITAADAAVKNGTLELDIEDIDDADEKKDFATGAKVANANDIVAYLDFTLTNIINQGSSEDTWDIDIESLTSPITVTLTLAPNVASQSSSYYIVRYNEDDDKYEQAPVTFDSAAKTVQFKYSKYMSYAIVKGSSSGATPTTPTTTTPTTTTQSTSSSVPQTGDTNDPLPLAIGAVCSALLAFVAARRIRAYKAR